MSKVSMEVMTDVHYSPKKKLRILSYLVNVRKRALDHHGSNLSHSTLF